METAKARETTLPQPRAAWLNRNVFGMGLTSLLSDAGHEMATAALPGFFAALGISAAALGTIEGVADATSSFVKLWAGWLSDRFGYRKPIAVSGYVLTGISKALFALAHGWPLILVGRVVAWFGRGIRGPVRDAMLADSVPQEARGRAFGFHRAGDTLGAIIGPLLAVGLLAYLEPHAADLSGPFRIVFLLTLIPGLGSAVCFAALVRETRCPRSEHRFWAAMGNLPAPFRRFLWGVGLFGMGDYAHTLLILAATQLLTPVYGFARAAQVGALLYVVRNVFYAAASYPVGALSDRWGRRGLLALGYVLGALATLGFVVAFLWDVSGLSYLLLLFALAGVYIAIEDALEGVLTADLVAPELRGTAYGVMGTVNGLGDLVASVMVGTLWTAVSPAVAFTCAAGLMLLGGAVIYRFR